MNQNLKSTIVPTWCPGCKDYIVFAAIQQALSSLDVPRENIVMVFDIGCIGNMADFFNTYGIHSLHGRSIPTAMGVKLANPNLTVIAIGGDGGIYGEGLGHLIGAARMNVDISVIVANNYLYSLTTGQTSPTSPKGSKTKSTPMGTVNVPIDPLVLLPAINPEALVESADGQDLNQVTQSIKKSINFKGFSLLDLRQVCVTFGKQLNN
jgi:2-oxoglutarate ferredoxin oxidoreductase subunit beta